MILRGYISGLCCVAVGPVETTNFWHASVYHAWKPFSRLLALDQIYVDCIAEKETKNKPTLFVIYTESVWCTHLLNMYAFPMSCRWFGYFIKHCVAFGKITKCVTVVLLFKF